MTDEGYPHKARSSSEQYLEIHFQLQRKHFSIKKLKLLMSLWEVTAVYSERHTNAVNIYVNK
jgi:hypothetical protein